MDMASAYNVGYAERVIDPEQLRDKLAGAIAHDGPSMVEVIVEQNNPDSGAVITGEWDLADIEE
jgi:acetolactate synthase-1/2/3 large subunit